MKKIILILIIFSVVNAVKAQGSSDAGVTSMTLTSPISSNFVPTGATNMIRFGAGLGKCDNSIVNHTGYFDYTRHVNSNISFNTRINFMYHAGNDIETGELGDVFFSGNFKIAPKLTSTVGFKLPLHNGDKVKKGVVLPMDYQPTLGTFDMLFSLNYVCSNWMLQGGWQLPLSQNGNQFLSENFVATENFQSTNKYYRNADVWARIAYMIQANNLSIIPNLTPIYHIANDSYVDFLGLRHGINGSQGLTLNGGAQLDYALTPLNVIGANVALPLIVRDAAPDGLGRKFVIGVDYRHSF